MSAWSFLTPWEKLSLSMRSGIWAESPQPAAGTLTPTLTLTLSSFSSDLRSFFTSWVIEICDLWSCQSAPRNRRHKDPSITPTPVLLFLRPLCFSRNFREPLQKCQIRQNPPFPINWVPDGERTACAAAVLSSVFGKLRGDEQGEEVHVNADLFPLPALACGPPWYPSPSL